ncbi:hypothetical protein DRP43_02315 [candidate division TA06 bacterium]|uniref:POTRA domain-containing protein n=1 Tax=candidate division TA06 bacterium TaxID=2250710 RepID=A0A660SLG9_UNCT6|nr:MAG: hypothetical protein DRP43_02315 [candidate division TA06 bacterium]
MILTVKRAKKHRRNLFIIKTLIIIFILFMLTVSVYILYNKLFIIKTVESSDDIKQAVEEKVIGKSLLSIKYMEITKLISSTYMSYDIKISKLIPGKLVITKKEIEPIIHIIDENIYINNYGQKFRVKSKQFYSSLKIYGKVSDLQIKKMINLSNRGIFKRVYVKNGYYIGKRDNDINVVFNYIDNTLAKRINRVAKIENGENYTMDIRFKNQVIIR